MADKKRGLGRGLSALIGDVDIGLSADAKAPTKEKSKKTSTLSSEETSSQGPVSYTHLTLPTKA